MSPVAQQKAGESISLCPLLCFHNQEVTNASETKV